ncbi:DUF4136 domain-containing protein [Cerasicoccus maritimus]|uniref:DUF4136 domain-containing protein n=1 Tax=Cerasicoccus maritimus TaxID=490089 RepID=UPI002852725C|nr:DUF4136 domain-containing protein [Cerasicoccus maritimus]
MHIIRLSLCLLFIAILGACSRVPKVQTQANPQANFSDIKTFAVLPLPTQITGADPGAMVEIAGPAKAAIVGDMEAKGYQQVSQADADILVNLHGELLPRTQVIDTGIAPPPGYYGDPWITGYPYASQQIVRNYEQGTLAIEISKNVGGQPQLEWVGWTTSKRAPGAKINVDNVVAGIHEILADFPPEK